MSSRRGITEFWDEEIGRWARGDRALHPGLERWLAGYAGRGAGAVNLEVIPEPYIGSLDGPTPALVMLGLNPGAGVPGFQGSDGVYTRRIRETSYSEWAASGPYSDEAWESVHGRNRYQHARLTFARRLHEDPSIQATDLLFVELYPFHSKRVTAAMLPPHDLLQRFILDPLSELDVPHVFAFGKPWIAAAERLGLGAGGLLPVEWATPSRQARVFPLSRHQQLVVVTQRGYAGPPGAADTEALAGALRAEDVTTSAQESTDDSREILATFDALARSGDTTSGNSWGISYFEERDRYRRQQRFDEQRLLRSDRTLLESFGRDLAVLWTFGCSRPGYYYTRATLFDEGYGTLNEELIGRYGPDAPTTFINLFREDYQKPVHRA